MCNQIINASLLNHPISQDTYKLFDAAPLPNIVVQIFKMAMEGIETVEPLSQFKYCNPQPTESNTANIIECFSKSDLYPNYFLNKTITNLGQTSRFVIADALDPEESEEVKYHFSNQFSLTCKENQPNRLSWEVEFLRQPYFEEDAQIQYSAKMDADLSGNLAMCSEAIVTNELQETTKNNFEFPLLEKFLTLGEEEDISETDEASSINEQPSSTEVQIAAPKNEQPPADSSQFSSTKIALGGIGIACAAYAIAKKMFSPSKPEQPKPISSTRLSEQ